MTSNISAEAIKGMINYAHLVSFCPPDHVGDLKKAARKKRSALAKGEGLKMKEFMKAVQKEAVRKQKSEVSEKDY